MNVEIITPDQELYKGDATSVVVPGLDGLLGILNDHAPLITALKAGTISVKNNGDNHTFQVKGGVVEVLNNKVIVLAE